MAIDFPNSPTIGDTYTTNGKTYRWDGTVWGVYGTFTVDSTASDTEPTGVGNGHIWYRSDQSQTLIRYDGTWVEIGSAGGFDSSSTSFPTSLDSGTGFAAVEALQAKVGVNSSGVATSHDYKIAQLEALGTATAFTPSWTGFTVGNAIESWYYVQVNDFVFVQGTTELGSTSSVTGSWRMDYPIGSPAQTTLYVGNLGCRGATNSLGVCQLGVSQMVFNAYTVSGATVWFDQVDATHPFSWTTGEELRASFMYQLS